jgi:hypothetical protein
MPRVNGPSQVNTRIGVHPRIQDLRKDLRKLGPDGVEFRARLKSANQSAAQMLVDAARGNATAMGGEQAAAASQIKAAKVEKGIRIRLANSKKVPFTLVAFWGAKQRTGWYKARRYEDSTPQHHRWVGNSWDVGVKGEGPYAINAAIADKRDEVLEYWRDALEHIARDAGFT